MVLITSPHNPTVKRLRSLADKKFRQSEGLFLAEGEKVLARAKACGWEPSILVATTAQDRADKAETLIVTPEVMAKISAQNNPPPVAAAFKPHWSRLGTADGLWLALEDMRDPGNLGTIIRTADAAGVAGIILAGTGCDPWGPECVRATMGSIFAVPLVRMTEAELLNTVRSWPGESVATHLRASEDYRRSYGTPTLVVMGSEGAGLSAALTAACSTKVRIPMREGPDSLNVAAATALMLYEARRSFKI